MSIDAISWALNKAPIPRDRRDASSLAIVLVGLADHADPDGRNAFPAIATLARYTRLSERAVQYAVRALEELGLITPSDPEIVAAYVKRADRRPKGWDLVIHRIIHNAENGAQAVHPVAQHGVQTRPHGVQTTTSRGASFAPEPSFNRPKKPSRARAHATARTRHDRPAGVWPMRCPRIRPGKCQGRVARCRPNAFASMSALPSAAAQRRGCGVTSTDIQVKIHQAIEAARQSGEPRPGRPTLVKLTGATDHQVRKVLAQLATSEVIESPTPTAGSETAEVLPDSSASLTTDATNHLSPANARLPRPWPLVIIGLAAAVAVWGGWVRLGELTGFGAINLLPGIGRGITLNTAVVLPLSVEFYSAYALRVLLASDRLSAENRRFARRSFVASLSAVVAPRSPATSWEPPTSQRLLGRSPRWWHASRCW